MFKSTQLLTTPPASPSLYNNGHHNNNNNNNNIYNPNEEYLNKPPKTPNHTATVISPPISPLHSLTRSPNNNNSYNNNSELPPPLSINSMDQNTVLYSGELMYTSPDSRFNRQKKNYCVLTPSSLIRFKSYEKACKSFPSIKSTNNVSNYYAPQQLYIQDQKVIVSLERVIAIYKINISSSQSAIRIQYLNPEESAKPLGFITLIPTFVSNDKNNSNNSNNNSLIPIWIHALRTAMEPYIPGLVSATPQESLSAIERTKRHNDRANDSQCEITHKVILKTKKVNPRASLAMATNNNINNNNNNTISVTSSSSTPLSKDSSSTSSSSSASSNNNTSSLSNSSSLSSTSSSNIEHKDIYIPVIFHLGHSSLYILPAKSYRDDFQRYLLRDRYGLLAIKNITVHESDDTISIDLCTVNGPSHRLIIISSVGRLLVCAIHKAIQQLVPHFPRAPYNLICPSLISHRNNAIKNNHLFTSSSLSPSSIMSTTTTTVQNHNNHLSKSSPISHWLQYLSQPWQQQDIISIDSTALLSSDAHRDAIISLFDNILLANCAAFNLNTQRFKFLIEKSNDHSSSSSSSTYTNNNSLSTTTYSITFLPPNEINENFTSYSRFELLVFFRTLRHIDYFDYVSFKNIPLTSLANWMITNEDSWSQHDINSMSFPTMLAKELYLLLTSNNHIKTLDLSGCNIISSSSSSVAEPSSPTFPISLSRFPTSVSLSQVNTSSDVSSADNQPVTMQSYTSSNSSTIHCQQCAVQGIFLAIQKNSMLNLSTLLLDGHHVHDCDVDLLVHLIISNTFLAQTNPSTRPFSSKWIGLQHLSLRKSGLTGIMMDDLLSSITHGQMKSILQRIDLQDNDGWVSTEIFTEVWEECTALTHLSIPCFFKPDENINIINQQPKLLNLLNLSGSEFNDTHFQEICSWLTYHANTLKPPTKTQFELCLALQRCGLHGQHIHRLMHAVSVPHHRRLQFTLKVGDNPLIKQVVHQPWLWPSIAKGGPTSLSFQRIKWDSNSLKELFDALVQNKTIEKIDLSYGTSDNHFQEEEDQKQQQEEKKMIQFNGAAINSNSNSKNNNNQHSLTVPLSITEKSTSPSTNDSPPRTSTDIVVASTIDSSTSQSFANMIIKMPYLTEIRMDGHEQQDDIHSSTFTNIKATLMMANKKEKNKRNNWYWEIIIIYF
ncbi:unnamed protein product [Cunninghamella echinulata]